MLNEWRLSYAGISPFVLPCEIGATRAPRFEINQNQVFLEPCKMLIYRMEDHHSVPAPYLYMKLQSLIEKLRILRLFRILLSR